MLASLSALALPRDAAAQSVMQQIGYDFAHAGQDMWFIWTSPFHGNASDWKTFGLAAGAVVAAGAFDERIDEYIRTHPSSAFVTGIDKFRDRGSFALADFGSARYLQPAAGGLYLVGLILNSRGLREAGMGCFAAYEANNVVRTLAYTAVARPRPVASPDDPYAFSIPGGTGPSIRSLADTPRTACPALAFGRRAFISGRPSPSWCFWPRASR